MRTCSIAALAADPRLANRQAQVMNVGTGEVLFDRGGLTASRTASVMKVLTAAAALAVFARPSLRDHRRQGRRAGSAVLVGGGDLTLSRTPSGSETVYPGAAHLDDLARQVRAAWNADRSNPPLTKLVLDSSLFGGETWHASWDPAERELGYMPHITALMVDGDRRTRTPTRRRAHRSRRPRRPGVRRRARRRRDRTRHRAIRRRRARAGLVADRRPARRQVPRRVGQHGGRDARPPRRDRAGHGQLVRRDRPGGPGGARDVRRRARRHPRRRRLGLSPDNAVPPAYLTRLFAKVDAREGHLGVILDGLPVSEQKGSLSYADRFAGDNAVADGAVLAKTGWITTGYTLAGVIRAQDGTTLTFAIYALGDVTDAAKQAIDTLATGFRCGDELADG